ncbi:MAG: DNA-directed RNA polymerase subunit E'' [Candidatus Pacearchaeota archaeon]|nr:DNA-directed RNA polymerase subunit E'' [Candidatus Pacearchaeota archaeon]
MAEKACKNCKLIFDGAKCPKCGSEDASDSYKGRVIILKPEESEIAKNMKLKDRGDYAIKVK